MAKASRRPVPCFFDGACPGNQFGDKGPMRAAYVILDESVVRDVPDFDTPGGPRRSNNIAEYHGLMWLLEAIRRRVARDDRRTTFRISGDSQLVIRQMTGQYRVRDAHLSRLHNRARELANDIPIEWRWIPRSENKAGLLLEQAGKATREN